MSGIPENTPSILVGIVDLEIEAGDLRGLAVLAAGAVAFMACIGNDEPQLALKALHGVAAEHSKLTPKGDDMLGMLSSEIIDAVRGGKEFAMIGTARVVPDAAGEPDAGAGGATDFSKASAAEMRQEALLQKIAEVAYGAEGDMLAVRDLLQQAGIGRSA